MTTQTSDTDLNLRRRERRTIPPFGDGSNPSQVSQAISNSLGPCRFAPFPDRPFIDGRSYALEASEYDRDIEPRFELPITNIRNLASIVGAASGDLCLSVSARARHLKRYLPLQEWSLDAVPGTWCPEPTLLKDLQGHRDISFILAVRVVSDTPHLSKNGLEKGKVLSRREFAVKRPMDSSFPFKWVDFSETAYPDEMLWVISWEEEDRDYNLPVNDILTVLVNKKADEALAKSAEVKQGRNIAWKMLASEITTEIWCEALTDIQDIPSEDDYETLAGQIFARISSVSGKSYPEILGLMDDEQDGRAKIRGLVSQLIKVVS